MAQHARLINGRLLLAGLRPWHEWPAADLLDMCDALRDDEHRFLIANGIKVPDLPDVDTSLIGLRTPAELGVLTVTVADDDDDWTWEPPDGADGGEGMTA